MVDTQHTRDRGPSPDDLWIAVTGVTGAGKSTFISLFADQEIEIGHGLYSTTKNVNIFRCTDLLSDRLVWFVDTPGFDDTQRSDTEILEEIATYFVKLYDKGIRFSGLFYLQRITDPRMSGTAVKNLELFKLISGNEAYPMVRLITTRWDDVDPTSAEYNGCIDRMRQLSDDSKFFQPLIQGGAQLLRHEMNTASGKAIVDSLLLDEQKFALNIQTEMLDSHMTLGQTSAGSYLNREYAELTKRFEAELKDIQDSMAEAMRERDEEALSSLRSEQEQYESRKAKLEQDKQQMTADFQELDARKARELRRGTQRVEEFREVEEKCPVINESRHTSQKENGHHSGVRIIPMDAVHDAKASKRDRMKQHLSAGWHKTVSKDHWHSRKTALQEVQTWLWGMVEEVHRAASRSR